MSEITPCRPKWKGAMTDRDRFNRQMHYESVDRCFNMEFGYWKENFQVWSIFANHGIRNNQQADVFFNFDRLAGAGGVYWLHPAFEEKVVSETETKRILQNGEGLLAEVPKEGQSTIPHYLQSSIETPEDWKRCKEERFRRDDPVRTIDVEALRARHPPDRDYPLAVNTGSMIGKIRDLMTFEGLAYAVHDYPDMVEDMVETVCLLIEDGLDQVLGKIDFDLASGWEDICFKSGPIVSVPFFKEVLLPRYKRIGRRLRAAGIDIWYTDCDGDIRPLLPLWMEAGLNTMFPFEVNCSGHPAELLNEYGRELRIMGGVDKLALGEGKEAIKRYLETLAPLVERGGFIPFCDHRCPPNVREEDYLYYLDLKEEMFGLGG
jgi:uroporphyrinogen decarboxylase